MIEVGGRIDFCFRECYNGGWLGCGDGREKCGGDFFEFCVSDSVGISISIGVDFIVIYFVFDFNY